MNVPSIHSLPGHKSLRRGRVSMPGQVYIVTAVTRHRVPWFTDFDVAAAAVRAFTRLDLLGNHEVLAWVLMPDHAHWLVRLANDERLPDLVNRMKSSSAREANRCLMRRGPLWGSAFHDHAVRDDESLNAIAEYIIRNPLRCQLAGTFGAYPFWDSVWLPSLG